jgi:hypothetical protein
MEMETSPTSPLDLTSADAQAYDWPLDTLAAVNVTGGQGWGAIAELSQFQRLAAGSEPLKTSPTTFGARYPKSARDR